MNRSEYLGRCIRVLAGLVWLLLTAVGLYTYFVLRIRVEGVLLEVFFWFVAAWIFTGYIALQRSTSGVPVKPCESYPPRWPVRPSLLAIVVCALLLTLWVLYKARLY